VTKSSYNLTAKLFGCCTILPVDSNFGVLKHVPEDNCNKRNMEDDNIMPVNTIY